MLARKELIFLLILYDLRHGSVLIFPCSCLLEVSYIRLKYNVLFVCVFVSQLQLQWIVCRHSALYSPLMNLVSLIFLFVNLIEKFWLFFNCIHSSSYFSIHCCLVFLLLPGGWLIHLTRALTFWWSARSRWGGLLNCCICKALS